MRYHGIVSSFPVTDERELTIAEKLRLALDLGECGLDVMREQLRRDYPDESDESIHRRLVAWFQDGPSVVSGDDERRLAPNRFCSS